MVGTLLCWTILQMELSYSFVSKPCVNCVQAQTIGVIKKLLSLSLSLSLCLKRVNEKVFLFVSVIKRLE
jgi:hypothetical protein